MHSEEFDILFIGTLPPPLCGASKNNEKILQLLKSGSRVYSINTSAPTVSHDRLSLSRLRRAWPMAVHTWRLLRQRKHFTDSTVYMVPDGGMGVIYQIIMLTIIRARLQYAYLHHRNFSYYDKPSMLHRLLWRMLPDQGTHIFLSPTMQSRHSDIYGPPRGAHIISNMALIDFEPDQDAKVTGARVRLGFLSNLCQEKGFYEAIDTFKLLRQTGIETELHIAGPAAEPGIERALHQLTAQFSGCFFYHGQVVGDQKRRFFHEIDVFLFPTKYKKEAEPNVILESLAAGTCVIANQRGCIGDIVDPADGHLVPASSSFSDAACEWLKQTSVDVLRAARHARQSSFRERTITHKQMLARLIATMQVQKSSPDAASTSATPAQHAQPSV